MKTYTREEIQPLIDLLKGITVISPNEEPGFKWIVFTVEEITAAFSAPADGIRGRAITEFDRKKREILERFK